MASLPPETYPITGLCVVADPDKCPPGYELLYRSFDKKDDCDLWKDSFFRARITRYLCITRVFPLDGGRLNNVLVDVVINNNGDLPPPGFTLVEKTVDTGERATRKKQLCVKMISRNTTSDAISDLIVLSKSKRPPSGYTLVGEMNGLCLCFKMTTVPPETQNLPVTNGGPAQAATPYGPPTAAPTSPTGYMNSAPSYPLPSAAHRAEIQGTGNIGHGPLVRQESTNMPDRSLEGVPFQLNQQYQALQNSKRPNTVPEIHFRSDVDIDNEYNYPFRLEKQAKRETE